MLGTYLRLLQEKRNREIVEVYVKNIGCLKHAANQGSPPQDGVTMIMAKDSDGRKLNRIPEYDRVQNGKTIHVSAHVRSIRSDCKKQRKNDYNFFKDCAMAI